jgi:SAM-dependent methyltransferase
MTWWRELYDEDVADLLLERRGAGETAALAEQIAGLLGVEPGDRVFDQCCGTGDITGALAALGLAVVGVDQAEAYIDRARRRAPGAELHVGDAARFVAEPGCAAALCWGTSFGYCETDAENQRMLRAAFDSLEPGGRYALDVMSLPGVLRQFQGTMVDRRDDLHLIRRTTLDLEAGAMIKRWTFIAPDREVVERVSRVRIYMPHQIAGLMEEVGFEIAGLFGGPGREPLAIDSLRCVVLARRPA